VESKKRRYDLGIWVLGLGFFIFYTPYSGLTKVVTKGLLPGMTGPVSGFEVLPVSVVGTVICMLGFITIMRWWKYPRRVQIFGINIPCPTWATFLSGVCMGTIMATTTLAFSFGGASIVFMLVLLRAGVLVLGPIVDASMKRRVRWFSWAAVAISLLACVVALTDVTNYTLGLMAVIDIAAYLTSYFFRLRLMTRLAKSSDRSNTIRYFVEEQMTAAPLLLLFLVILAFTGSGEIMGGFQRGFASFLGNPALVPMLLIGAFYAALCVCTTFIFLDRRENTFCIPIHSGSSLLSGIVASAVIAYLYQQPPTSNAQYVSAGLIMIALAILSPLHHLVEQLWRIPARAKVFTTRFGLRARVIEFNPASITEAVAGQALCEAKDEGSTRRIILFVCSGNTCRSPMAEAIWNAEISDRLGVRANTIASDRVRAISAGISARPGAPITAEAAQALTNLGVPVSFSGSQSLTPELVDAAEALYCMTEAHRNAVVRMTPSAATKIWCLDATGDIEDPIGGKAEVYVRCASRIQSLVRLRLDEMGIAA
jgi:protein-tyrosine-phosphatase